MKRLALFASLAIPLVAARAQDAEQDGERLAWTIVPEVVRISETVSPGRSGEEGFGLVVGERDGSLFVVTADHVVRDSDGRPFGTVQVTFEAHQGVLYDASLLDLRLPPRHGDLAVLSLPKPPHMTIDWPAAADLDSLVRGERAWRVGKQERWTPSVNPGAYVGLRETIWLDFDSLDTPHGSSGGPVVTRNGIVGLVIADGDSSGDADKVLPIDTIGRQLRLWEVPWNLTPAHPRVTSTALPASINAMALTPAPPITSARPSLADAAGSFVSNYYAGLSDDGGVVLARLPGEVADPIDFYGKQMTLSAYLSVQDRYFRRWPKRMYRLRPDQLDVRCHPAQSTCDVLGTIEYDVQDDASGRRSTGSERVFLRLIHASDHFVIVEQGPPAEH